MKKQFHYMNAYTEINKGNIYLYSYNKYMGVIMYDCKHAVIYPYSGTTTQKQIYTMLKEFCGVEFANNYRKLRAFCRREYEKYGFECDNYSMLIAPEYGELYGTNKNCEYKEIRFYFQEVNKWIL